VGLFLVRKSTQKELQGSKVRGVTFFLKEKRFHFHSENEIHNQKKNLIARIIVIKVNLANILA